MPRSPDPEADTLPEPTRTRGTPSRRRRSAPPGGSTALDGLIVVAFAALTFLLGVFPLNDTDFWWHLRTGDLIRQTGEVPRVDPYLYGGPPEKPWIDLHWGFEVLLSWGYERGGVVLLNLAKCSISTLAVLLLLTSRRRDWPIPVMVLAWLPALLVLGGRMYVRPETLTLLFLAAFLAILFRWKERPRLAFLLPVVQVLWVNVQGLFVFGPFLVGAALIDAALERGAFLPARRPWWRAVLTASALTGLACLVNPYGLWGALFPIQLLRTMGDPVFENIGELQPLPKFIRSAGWGNPSLHLHLATMGLGALSFLLPIAWRVAVRLGRSGADPGLEDGRRKPAKGRSAGKSKGKAGRGPGPEPWRLSPFRLILFVVFSALSWKATRNSHQFAAVVGTVTAWNFGEWAAAIRRRRLDRGAAAGAGWSNRPRLAVLGVVLLALTGVASGAFYAWVGEGRTIGLGEKPLWYPHEAVAVAGRPGMPDRFACFHNGHAALFEYAHGPDKKVFADARLEVIGADLYKEYRALDQALSTDDGTWKAHLREQGQPGVLADLVQSNSEFIPATLLADPDWRCVWFDAVASVFVHRSSPAASGRIDFLARHFEGGPGVGPEGVEEWNATARALRNVANVLKGPRRRADLARPLLLLGRGYAHRALSLDPESADAWKQLGLIEMLRLRAPEEAAIGRRVREPFDPVLDLRALRVTHALDRAARLSGGDFLTLLTLERFYEARGMAEAALPLLGRLGTLRAINPLQREVRDELPARIAALESRLGPPPSGSWDNRESLERAVALHLGRGRVASAADLLERAYPPAERSWEVTDRLATLRLHLGQPAAARAAWQAAAQVPRPGLRESRLGMTYLIEEDPESARRHFLRALEVEPTLFDAHYGLAVLESDAGRRGPAHAAAGAAVEHAPSDEARAAAREILDLAAPAPDAAVGSLN